jgi:hypothetical protein
VRYRFLFKLIPANESRSLGPWSDEDFDVVLLNAGERVSHLRETCDRWRAAMILGLGFPNTLNARQPDYGTAIARTLETSPRGTVAQMSERKDPEAS